MMAQKSDLTRVVDDDVAGRVLGESLQVLTTDDVVDASGCLHLFDKVVPT
jgi:hypothetical protein